MKWFMLIFGFVAVVLFVAMCIRIKMAQRREIDPEYDAKLTRIENRIDPIYNFFVNLVMWAFALWVIYYVYMG